MQSIKPNNLKNLENNLKRTNLSALHVVQTNIHKLFLKIMGYIVFLLIIVSAISALNVFAAEDSFKTIAITEIVEHPSLREAKRGIIDELQDSGYESGKNLKIIEKNAQGAIANSMLIAKQFIQMQPDAIIPISTPSLQSMIKIAGNTDIPLVFSSVSDPYAASGLSIEQMLEKNITGAVDAPPIQQEIELIKYYLPNIKSIGLLYSSGEANSVKVINSIKDASSGEFEYIEAQIASSSQIKQAVESLIGRVDAIYIPSDNTVFSALPKLVQMSREHKIPVFSSDPDSIKAGVFACVGYSQYEIGRSAGRLLVRILNGESNLPIDILKESRADQMQVFVNEKTAKILGFELAPEINDMKVNIVGKE